MKSKRLSPKVTMFAVLATVLVVAPARADDSSSAPVKSISGVLKPFVDHHTLAGAVTLVADKDKVLSLESVGFADIAGKKPMPTDALFWIASQSKPITATALMILVDEGKVKVDDPVSKYLPEFKNIWVAVEKDNEHMLLKRPGRPITVRDVLNHTSGMPFGSAMEPTIDALPLRDAVRSYAITPLQTEPGTKYAYSNAGINTGGRIIEVVSGMPYEQFLQKRLFDPLGMKDTTFWPNDDQLKRLAKSYKPNGQKDGLEETTINQLQYPLNDTKHRYPCPAGGLFSTASDLGSFCQMVLNGGVYQGKRLLSEEAVKTMSSKQTPEELKDGYGLGWSTGGSNFGHGGAYSTGMTIDTKRGLVTVWMVQHAGFPTGGEKSRGEFQKTAEELFGGTK
jgi:CubicO group peptidase (beta-lactamase class C family)